MLITFYVADFSCKSTIRILGHNNHCLAVLSFVTPALKQSVAQFVALILEQQTPVWP